MNFELLSHVQKLSKIEVVVFGVFKKTHDAIKHPTLKSLQQWAFQHMLPELGESVGSCVSSMVPTASNTVQVVLVQLGSSADFDLRQYRKALEGLSGSLKPLKQKNVLLTLTGSSVHHASLQDVLTQTVLWCRRLHYRFNYFKSEGDRTPPFKKVSLWVGAKDLPKAERYVHSAVAVAEGIELCKDLGNLPGNVCTPIYLAKAAQDLAKKHKKMSFSALTPEQMKKLGMNCFLSVAQGSAQPPRLICVEYAGGSKKQAPVVLVGKGITFDSGGTSLKPGPMMDEMKYDMCGAASVLGVMHAISSMQLPLNVVGLIAAAENMPGSKATRPGDVVRSMSGLSVEILNTDAEGRLVLCDTLTYAKRYKPALMIDLATLTGSIVMALGAYASGLFSKHDALANALIRSGEKTYDRFWRMPLWEEHLDALQSNFADLPNIPDRPPASSSVAAVFLSRFVDPALPWAHLDIAGTAWNGGKEKGGTGRPILALCHFLMHYAEHQEF